MATLADAVHEVVRANELLRGSFKTQKNRRLAVTGFLTFVRDSKALTRSIKDIEPWMVHDYASYCLAQDMTPQNLANIFCAIRVVLRAVGNDLGNCCSNHQLGLPRRVRKGAHRAQTDADVNALMPCAASIDAGFAHLVALALHFGLRRLEALMCGKDLGMWLHALMSGQTVLHLMRGSKNQRPRTLEVIGSRREETIEIVKAAYEYAVAHDYVFITGRDGTLKSAANRMSYLSKRVGMAGEQSFHSLRYTYALRLAYELRDAGIAPYEILVRLSASLGHGPTRVAMIRNHYCQEISDWFKDLKLPKGEEHRRSPANKMPRPAARRKAKLEHARRSGFPIGQTDWPTNAKATASGRGARRGTGRNSRASPTRSADAPQNRTPASNRQTG